MGQFDAFENYVAEAEKEGPENFPPYKWTRANIEAKSRKVAQVGSALDFRRDKAGEVCSFVLEEKR
jgi:hypothetical protein